MLKTIKYFSLFVLVIASTLCHGQSVRFQFYRTKACSSVEKLDTAYSLYKIPGSLDTDYLPKKGVVYLPGKGRYGIAARGPLFDTVFNIRDTGLFVFRLKEPDHGLYYTGAVDTPPLYSQCDILLNGYNEYHFENGSLEMRGTFSDGSPKDSLVTFYRNGQTRKRMLKYPKVVVITMFDSLGNRLSIHQHQNKSFMVYSEYQHKDFFPDGKLKHSESSKKKVKRIKEFSEDGRLKIVQTKNYRTEYYNNGTKSVKYTWSSKRDHIFHSNDFTITKTDYDITGQISRIAVYSENWEYPVPQPHLALNRADWIISLDKYQDGNKVFSISDMDMKEFIKKNPAEAEDNYNEDN